jgi:hypothetical protein
VHRLFTYGYASGHLRDLDKFVEQGALIADIRYSPHSKRPEWNREALQGRYGSTRLDFEWWA